ncbi:MAG: hypothetical protein HGA61_02425 [Candidatus Moranbacteria bacterium]|nr:hypothetical protein [Candidatus Moranbacteria bacterium]
MRIVSWASCLAGLPAWVSLFMIRHDWIAACLETSAVPSIILGITNTLKGSDKSFKLLDCLSIVAIVLGLSYSIYDLGGFGSLSQWLEIALASTFLAGTYLLAKKNANGYLWYVAMHILCALLTANQGFPMLAAQQLASLLFIVDAYRIAKKK